MKHIFNIILLSLIALPCWSQNNRDIDENLKNITINDKRSIGILQARGAIYLPPPPPKDIDGSYYFNDNYLVSEILLTDGKTLKEISVRYNIINDAMEFVQDGQTKAFYKEKIRRINVGGDIFEVVNVIEDGKSVQVYMKGTSDKENFAFTRYQAQVVEPYYNPGIQRQPNRKIETKKHLYVRLDLNSKVIRVKNKKEFLSLFGENAKRVKEYMKKKRFKSNNAADLQKVIIAYRANII